MSDIRNVSGISVDAGVSAPVADALNVSETLQEDVQAFDDALEKGDDEYESRSPETRRAIKRSLERLQAPPETDRASASDESEPANAGRGASTRRAAGGRAGAVTTAGAEPPRDPRRGADAGGAGRLSGQEAPRGVGHASPAASSAATGGQRSVPDRADSRGIGRAPAASGLAASGGAGPVYGLMARRGAGHGAPASGSTGASGEGPVPGRMASDSAEGGEDGAAAGRVIPRGVVRGAPAAVSPAASREGPVPGRMASDSAEGGDARAVPGRVVPRGMGRGAPASDSPAASREGPVPGRKASDSTEGGDARVVPGRVVPRGMGRGAPASDSPASGGADPVSGQEAPRDDARAPPAVSGQGPPDAPAYSRVSEGQRPAAADRMQGGAAVERRRAPGRARANSEVAVFTARTTTTPGAPADPMGASRRAAASRTESPASGTGATDALEPDVAAVDASGAAAAAGNAEAGRASAPNVVQPPASRVAEFAEQVADRILVSIPDTGAPGEVRISLKQSVLDGSEVRIFHEGGELKVVFVAVTESAQRFLADNQTQLQQVLGERLPDRRVQVGVETPNSGGTSREDNRGRSRQRYVRPDDSSDAS